MARLNVLLTGYEITDYLFKRTSSAALALDHDTIRGTADLEIWTGAGGTGTQLALTTDYTVSDEDTDLSTEAGVSIYTKLAIVNGTYHNVDLYATYKTIGDYASTSSVRLVQIGLKEITGNYTVTADDHTIIVNTASAVTITIPDGFTLGFDLCISRIVASTYEITVAMSGAETIENATSFVVYGAKAASEYDPSEVTLRKTTNSNWAFVAGLITGYKTGTGRGRWSQYPSGLLIQRGAYPALEVAGGANTIFALPKSFSSYSDTLKAQITGSFIPTVNPSSPCVFWMNSASEGAYYIGVSQPIHFIAIGPWR